MNRIITTLLILLSGLNAQAQSEVSDRIKNSWDSNGFLWVVGIFVLVIIIIVIFSWLEKRRKPDE